jgi:hypothetical protein
MTEKKNKKNNSKKESKFLDLKNIDKSTEAAVYYGFMPIELPKIDKEDKDNIYNNIEKYIEKNIEKKLNSLLETLPEKLPKEPIVSEFHNMTMRELYKNTLQTTIDIINDITEAYNKYDYVDINNYIYIIIDILTKEDRKLYVGIIFIFLSFIIYFIDGASV